MAVVMGDDRLEEMSGDYTRYTNSTCTPRTYTITCSDTHDMYDGRWEEPEYKYGDRAATKGTKGAFGKRCFGKRHK